jgi:hypothetical protein
MTGILYVDQILSNTSSTVLLTQTNATTITLGASGQTVALGSSVSMSNFKSTGITDSGTTTALTINSSGQLGVGVSPSYSIDTSGVIRAQTNFISLTNTAISGISGYDWTILGALGANASRGSGIVIGDINGAFWLANCGGYSLSFSKSVGSSATSAASCIQFTGGGASDSSPNVHITNTLSKGSGSFCIEHPLPSLSATHQLVHSFIEGPQADLIYRGVVNLVNGTATINIDKAATMTEGTFVVLNTNVQCFTTNETGWTAVKGKVIGNQLIITAQDSNCTDTISWMVIGERCDPHIFKTEFTDEKGKVIVESLKKFKDNEYGVR